MRQRQLEFWDRSRECDQSHNNALVRYQRKNTKQSATALIQDERAYVSLKRVSVVHEGSIQSRPQLTTSADAKDFFGTYWREQPGNDQERFVVACLDTQHRIQSVVVASIGTLDASLIHPREVFKPAILEGSSAIILSHNHPSGDPTPSPEDRAVTDNLTQAGEILGIDVLDHIIHGDGTHQQVSLRDN